MIVEPKLLRLKDVDYSHRSEMIDIISDGVMRQQTIIFSGADYFGEKYYFTEEGLRYIQDSRERRWWQELVLDYLNKIPIILKTPAIMGRSVVDHNSYVYGKMISHKPPRRTQHLLLVVLKKLNVNVVWNIYWAEENHIPHDTEVVFHEKSARKLLR